MNINRVVFVSTLMVLSSTCQVLPRHVKIPRLDDSQKLFTNKYKVEMPDITANQENVFSHKEVSKESSGIDLPLYELTLDKIMNSKRKEQPLKQYKIQNPKSNFQIDGNRIEMAGWNDGYHIKNSEFLHHPKSRDEKVRLSNRKTKQIFLRRKREALEENTDMKQNFSSEPTSNFTLAPEEHSSQYLEESFQDTSLNDIGDSKQREFSIDSDSEEIVINDSAVDKEISDEYMNETVHPEPRHSRTQKRIDQTGLHATTSAGLKCNGCQCGCKDGKCLCDRQNKSSEERNFSLSFYEDTSRESRSSNEEKYSLINNGVEESFLNDGVKNVKKPYISTGNVINSVLSPQIEEISNEIFSSESQKHYKNDDYGLYSEEFKDEKNSDDYEAFSGLGMLDQTQKDEFGGNYGKFRHRRIGDYISPEFWGEVPHSQNFIYERNLRVPTHQSGVTVHGRIRSNDNENAAININNPQNGEYAQYTNFRTYNPENLISKEITPLFAPESRHVGSEKLISSGKSYSPQNVKIPFYEDDKSDSTDGASHLTSSDLSEERKSYPISQSQSVLKFSKNSLPNSFPQNSKNKIQEKLVPSQNTVTRENHYVATSTDERVLNNTNVKPQYTVQGQNLLPDLESVHNPMYSKDEINLFDQSTDKSFKRPRNTFSEIYYTGDSDSNYDKYLRIPFVSKSEKHVPKQSSYYENPSDSHQDYTQSHHQQRLESDLKSVLDNKEFSLPKSYVPYSPAAKEIYLEIPRPNDKIWKFRKYADQSTEGRKFTESERIIEDILTTKTSKPTEAKYDYTTELQYSQKPKRPSNYFLTKLGDLLSVENPKHNSHYNHKDKSYYWQEKYNAGSNSQDSDKANKHELQHIYDLKKFGTDKGNAYKHSKEVNTNNANWKMDESLEDKMSVILEKEQEDNCEEIVKLLLSQSTDTDIEPLLRQIDHPRGTNGIAKIFREVGICDLNNYKTGKTENSDEIIDNSERDKATLYKINNANNIITLDNLKETDSTFKIDKFSPYNIDHVELKNILKLLLNNIKLSNIQENKKHQYIHNHNLDISDGIMTSLSPRDEPDSTGNSKYASHKNEYEDRTAEIIKIYPSEKEYDIILENKVKSDHQTVSDENLNNFQNKLTQNTFHPRKFHHLDSTEEIINFPLLKNKYSNIEDSTKYKSSKIINPENSREYVKFSSHNKPLDSIIEDIEDASFINDHLYSDEITTLYTSNDKDDKIYGNKPGISTEIYSCNERGHKIYDNQFSPYHSENKDKIAEFESKKNEFNDIAENAKHVGQHLKIGQSINSDEVKLTSEEIDYNLTPYKVHFSENNAGTLKHLSSNKKFDKYNNYRGSHEDTADHLTYRDKTYYDRAFIKHELQKLLSSQDDETETFYKPYINSHDVADLNELSYNNEHSKDDEELKHSTRIFLKQKQIHKLLGTGSNEEISSDKHITVKNHVADLTPADVEVIRYDVIENPKFLVGKEENLKTYSVKDDNFASINKYNCDILHGNSKSYENQISKPVLTSSEENNDRIKEESLLKKLSLRESLPSELKKQELKIFNELLNSNLYKDVTQTELGEVMKSLVSNDHDELYKDAVQLETEHAISKIIDQNRVTIKDTENIIKKQNHDLMTAESYGKLQDAINACRKLKKLIGKDKNNDDFKLSVLKLLKEVGPLQNIPEDNSDILKIIKYYTVLNSDADDVGGSAEETEEKTGSSEGHYSSDFQNKKYSMPYIKKKTQDQTLGKNVFKLEEITENLISAQNKENGEEKEVPKINTKNDYSTVIHKTLPVERIIINDGSRYNYDKSGDVQNLQVIIRENTLKKIRDEDDKFSSLQKNSQEDKCKTYNELLPLYYKFCELQQKEYEKSKDHLYKNIDIPKHEDYINTSEYLKTKILHSSFRDENSVHNREPINTFEWRRKDNHNPEVDVYLKNVHSEDYKKWTSPNDDDYDNVDFRKQNHKHPYEDLLKLISDDKLHLNRYFKSDEDKSVDLAKNELLKIQESFIKPRCSEIIQIFRLKGICSEENDVREVDNLDNYIEYESNMKLPNKLKSEIVIHNRDIVYPNGDEITDLSTDIYDNIPTFNERYDNQINKHNESANHFDNSDLYEKIKILTRYLDSLDSRYEDSTDKTAFKKVFEGSIKSFPEIKHYLIQKDIIHEHNNLDAREKNEHIITEVKDKIVNNLYPNKDSYIVDTITDEDIENVTDELMVTKEVNIIPNKIDDIIEKWCRSKIESRKQSDILNKAENDLIREKLRVRLVKMILKKLKDQINDNRYESKSSVISEMSPYCRHICYGDNTVREYKVPLIAIRKDMCHKCKGNKLTRVFNKPPISTTSDKEITDKYTKSIQRVDIYPSPIKGIDVYPNNKEIVEIIHPNYFKSFNDYGLQRQNVKEIIDIKPKYIQEITGIKPKSVKEIGLYPNYVTDIIPNQFRENFHIQPNHIKEIIYTYPNHSKEINGIQVRENNEISAIFPKYNETEVYPKRLVENIDITYPSNFKQFLDTQWKYVRARPEHIKDISDVHSERNNDKLNQILPPKPLIDNTAGKYENYISKPDYVDYLGHIFRERSPRSHSDIVSENSEDLTQINPSSNENQDTFNPEQSFDIEPKNRRKRNPQQQRIKKMSHNSSETQIKPPAQKS